MRLKLEGEAWGYRASPDLGATDPTLPLTTRMALARRTMRVQEAELEAKEAEKQPVLILQSTFLHRDFIAVARVLIVPCALLSANP